MLHYILIITFKIAFTNNNLMSGLNILKISFLKATNSISRTRQTG